jgi:hypothetical protein
VLHDSLQIILDRENKYSLKHFNRFYSDSKLSDQVLNSILVEKNTIPGILIKGTQLMYFCKTFIFLIDKQLDWSNWKHRESSIIENSDVDFISIFPATHNLNFTFSSVDFNYLGIEINMKDYKTYTRFLAMGSTEVERNSRISHVMNFVDSLEQKFNITKEAPKNWVSDSGFRLGFWREI